MKRCSVVSRWLAVPCIGLIKVYQYTLSPILGRQCRFVPTCSWYALDAFRTHGAFRGGWLTIRRLGRCQPFCKGGYDPVPVAEECDEHRDMPGG
ncbi:MAG: membrane protein insertion efficiency factor YidD [Phycisphaeraceae bacterium]|nr:membrane protein insertion efficiency factor YidD [Phycisphaeraceae bacterium]MCW5754706.1 membrane protein insertion efficiency factor YidD [Phycisphaeraceae bacterium]